MSGSLRSIGIDGGELARALRHEVGARLRAIAGFTTILQEDHGAQLGPDGVKVVDTIQTSTRRAVSELMAVCDLLRLSERELRFDTVDTGTLVRECFERAEREVPDANATLELERLPAVLGDRELLARVWSELFANSFKHRARDRALRVTVGADERQASTTVRTTDNGTGFDPRFSSRVLDLFQTLQPYDDCRSEGAGLAIARAIVTWHGGQIDISTTPGQGTCVAVSLPRTRQA